jgi:8-oxo-dGTP diphosphatase
MTEPRHTVVVGCLVRNRAGEVLLVRHRQRGWEIPQGRVEEGEGLMQALRREVLEEAGIEVEPGPLVAVYSKTSPPQAIILNFLADYRSGDLQPNDECPEVAWCSAEQALSLIVHPVNADRLGTLLGFDGRITFRAYTTGPFQVQDEILLGTGTQESK